jgi:hypothetical protein
MEALALVRKYVGNRKPAYPADESVPLEDIVPDSWKPIVVENEPDSARQVNRVAYEVYVLRELRERLRTKEVWVAGSQRYPNPEEDLPVDFEQKRPEYYSALRLSADAKGFVNQIRQERNTNSNFSTTRFRRTRRYVFSTEPAVGSPYPRSASNRSHRTCALSKPNCSGAGRIPAFSTC